MLVEADAWSGTDASATSSSVTVVPVDPRLPGATDVGQALDRVAGATVLQLGGLGDFSAVSIRGSSLRQVQVHLDGVPLNPDGSDVINLSELPLRAFQRVEVWRSNPPASFAAAPIGGVVNLVVADAPDDQAGVTMGSYHTGRIDALGAADAELRGRTVDALVFADLLSTRGDFQTFDDNATIYSLSDDRLTERGNNDKHQLSAHGRLRGGGARARLTLQDSVLSRDEGLPGHSADPAESARLDTFRNLAVARAEARGATTRSDARLWLLQRVETFDDRSNELGVGTQFQRSWYTTVGGTAHGAWAPRAWIQPALTLSARQESYVLADLSRDLVETPRRRLAGTAALSADLRALDERFTASPVLQLTALDSRGLGTVPFEGSAVAPEGKDQQLSFDPRLGLLFRPIERLSLKANVGHYLRPPDLTELFGDQGASIGNEDLVPEQGWAWDVGARAATGQGGKLAGTLDLTAFWSDTTDLIVWTQNSQRTLVPVNVGRAWAQGIEAASDVALLGWLDSQAALTWTLSRNLTPLASVADNQLPRIPEWQASVATSLHWDERVRLGHTWTWSAGSYWDATNWYLSPPRSLHGAFLRLQAAPDWPSLELAALNLSDRIAEVVPRNPLDETDGSRIVQAVTDFAGYPLPGRTFLATVRWTF